MHYNSTGTIGVMSRMEVDNVIKSAIQELEHCFMKAKHFFGDSADVFCYLNIRSWKRKMEYKQCCFLMLSRKLHRMAIEQLCTYVECVRCGDFKKIDVASRGLFNNNRVDAATENNIRIYTKEILEKWLEMECEMAEKLKDLWYKLLDTEDEKGVILASFVKCLFDDTTKKIKYIERQIMDYESVGYSSIFIKMHDEKVHDHYKKKLESIGKIIG